MGRYQTLYVEMAWVRPLLEVELVKRVVGGVEPCVCCWDAGWKGIEMPSKGVDGSVEVGEECGRRGRRMNSGRVSCQGIVFLCTKDIGTAIIAAAATPH